MIVLLQKKQKLRNEINWIELKLNEFSTARKNKPLSLPLKKKPVVKIWSEKWFEKKNHHHSTIQPFFDTTKKWIIMKKKIWIVIKFGLTYLKRTSLCTWKVHIPFLSTTLQNTAQSRAKKCLFCIQNKKVVKQLLAKMILKKSLQ